MKIQQVLFIALILCGLCISGSTGSTDNLTVENNDTVSIPETESGPVEPTTTPADNVTAQPTTTATEEVTAQPTTTPADNVTAQPTRTPASSVSATIAANEMSGIVPFVVNFTGGTVGYTADLWEWSVKNTVLGINQYLRHSTKHS